MRVRMVNITKWTITGMAVVGLGIAGLSTRSQVSATPFSGGADTYKAKCSMCHGADGKGNTPAGKNFKLRDLGSAEVQSQSDDQLRGIIANGKNKMPGFQKTLGADAVNDLVKYVRSLKH